MRESFAKICYAALILLVVLAALIHLAYYFPRTVDDLFIYLRYAENFAHGKGLVYNPAERIEGFSSPPWVILQSLAFLSGVNAVTFTKGLGVLSFAALLAAAGFLVKELTGGNRFIALFTCLLLSMNSYIVSWSVLGLETPFFLAAMLWTVYALLKFEQSPGIARGAWLVTVSFLFSISRPEAPLFLALISLVMLLARLGRPGFVKKVRILALPAGAVALLFIFFIMARYAYYGDIVPHVYFAKHGSGPELSNLSHLVANGALAPEIIFMTGGIALSILLIRNLKLSLLSAVLAASLVFTSHVKEDWMPSMRFLLPAFVALIVVWLCAIDWFMKKVPRRPLALIPAVAMVAMAAWYGLDVARVESRFMSEEFHSHGGGKEWVRWKSWQAAKTTIQCLRRDIPQDIESLPIDSLGMIHQLFDVLETSSQPLENSWFVGRDIGMVGYFSPVRVFDTDGLFTPALSSDEQWKKSEAVSPALVEKAFSQSPVAAELLDNWGTAAANNNKVMKRYEVISGSMASPRNLRLLSARPPAMDVVLMRYKNSFEKFPSQYLIQTLHGEAAGASMLRRFEYIENIARDHKPLVVTALDVIEAEGHASFPGARLMTYGCSINPAKVRPGSRIIIKCYFQKTGHVERSYKLFVHFDGPTRFQGDHFPVGGLLPTTWFPDGIVKDVFRLKVPQNSLGGDYRLFFGFYTDQGREKAIPPCVTDGNNRVLGPALKVF